MELLDISRLWPLENGLNLRWIGATSFFAHHMPQICNWLLGEATLTRLNQPLVLGE
jgi:hypothetical protein